MLVSLIFLLLTLALPHSDHNSTFIFIFIFCFNFMSDLFYVNYLLCLFIDCIVYRRQFALNAKPCFPGKIRRLIPDVVCRNAQHAKGKVRVQLIPHLLKFIIS